jgi:hypothetical protein
VNFGSVLAGAAQGFLMTGNPIGAGIGAIAGAAGGSGALGASGVAGGVANTVSGLGNVAMSAGQTEYLAANEQLQQQQLAFQLAEQKQADSFDNVTSEKSEIMRESNELRNVAMEQRKADNEITKEFIKSIV